MRRPISAFVPALALLTLLGGAPLLGGCELFMTPTKTAKGQLYQSGDPHYDGAFDAVHKEQIASADWSDEAKTSRKPIVTALDLKPGASNGTILSATREKKGAASLGPAVEQTNASEIERGKRMYAVAARLDDLKKQLEELRKQATEERHNMGAAKADDKQTERKEELRRELSAAGDAVDTLAGDARRAAKEAEDLAERLTAAWTGKDEDEKTLKLDSREKRDEKKDHDEKADKDRADKDDKKDDKKKPDPAAKKPASGGPAKKPAPKPESTAVPEEKPAPKPQPTAKPPDEVFNP